MSAWKTSFLNHSHCIPELVPIWHCHYIWHWWHNIMLVFWKNRWTFCMTSTKKHSVSSSGEDFSSSYVLLSARWFYFYFYFLLSSPWKWKWKCSLTQKCRLHSSWFFFWPTSSLPRYMLCSLYSIRSDRNSLHYVISFSPWNRQNQKRQVKEFFGPHESGVVPMTHYGKMQRSTKCEKNNFWGLSLIMPHKLLHRKQNFCLWKV